jgi:hypothetical protein
MSESPFSWKRVGPLFLVLVIGGLPAAVTKYLAQSQKRAQEENDKQAELNRQVEQIRQSAERGETGEASRRLFGVPERSSKISLACGGQSSNGDFRCV